jgi:single-strand DNA-binding protein
MSITIYGYVGKDAEMKFLPSGKAVTNFSVAINRSYKKDDEWVNQTLWMKVTCWGALAEAMNTRVKKGMFAIVEGDLNADYETGSPRIWEGSDGKAHASFEMTASKVHVHWVDKDKKVSIPKEEPSDFDDRFEN